MRLPKTAAKMLPIRTPFVLRATLLILALAGSAATHARAQGGCDDDCIGPVASAPEIDPSLGAGGLALLGGMVLLVRGRRVR